MPCFPETYLATHENELFCPTSPQVEPCARPCLLSKSVLVKVCRHFKTKTRKQGAQNAGRVNSYKRAQAMGVKLEQEWLASLDTRTRHSHRRAPGERVRVGEKFSNGCRWPGDPNAPYSEVMNCRCTLVAALEGVEDSARERFSRLPEGMTYEQWKGLAATSINELTPCLRRLSDNKIVDTCFETVDPLKMNLKDWEFAELWPKIRREGCTVKGLYARGNERAQGLLAYKDMSKDSSVFVELVESAPQNNAHNKTVKGKEYSGVGGHLFAEAVNESFDLGYNGFVGFVSKTRLIDHYTKTLGATQVGTSQRMYIDEIQARRLYERYYGNKGL